MRLLLSGAVAGAAGTAVEALLSAVQMKERGDPAVYDPGQLAGRLARRHLGVRLGRHRQRQLGRLMRWTYGPTWGVALALARRGRWGRAWPLWGLGLGAAVFGFEVVALPGTGATPPLSSWGPEEVRLDAVNTLAFGLAVALVLRLARRQVS
jgi:hypothetical protein